MKRRYTVTVGETGNEVGHTSQHDCETDAGAIRAAKRMVAPYKGDGWWTVCDDTGRPVAYCDPMAEVAKELAGHMRRWNGVRQADMKTKHTDIPWHQNANCKQEIVFSDGASVRTIAQCPSNLGYYDAKKNHNEAVANAELIVRAVNSHAELVEALQAILAADGEDWEAGRKVARAALEKAGAA